MTVTSQYAKDTLLVWYGAVLSSRRADDVTHERRHSGLYVTIVHCYDFESPITHTPPEPPVTTNPLKSTFYI